MKTCIDSRYLVFPVGNKAQVKKLKFKSKGKLLFDLDIGLDYADPDYNTYINVERFAGTEMDIVCEPEMGIHLEKSDVLYENERCYGEELRPLFHFTCKRGWLNDPNGLVYHNGTYHMFFQHNPAGCNWGNMHWGHAISKDLLHWQELDCALYPDEMGTEFSGSAIVDRKNVSGLGSIENPAIFLLYTAAGGTSVLSAGTKFTQCTAYSADGGKTFTKFCGNPIVPFIAGDNRDPKVIYHTQTDTYILALFLDKNTFALLSSKNLLQWEKIQEVTFEGLAECPDFYPLPLDGDENNIKWVFSAAPDRYVAGSFDGSAFRPETPVSRLHYGKHSYAAQTWSDNPDGRRLRIAWNNCDIPNMPFNMSMTAPCEMTLKSANGTMQLCANPVREIENLYQKIVHRENIALRTGEKHEMKLDQKAYDIRLQLSCREDTYFRLSVFGVNVDGNLKKNTIACLGSEAPMYAENGKVRLRILLDKTGVELFISDGEAFISNRFLMDYNLDRFIIKAEGVPTEILSMDIAEIGSIWADAQA